MVCTAGQQEGSKADGNSYILKRIFSERGLRVRQAGFREAYFGRLLQSRAAVLQVCLSLPNHNIRMDQCGYVSQL